MWNWTDDVIVNTVKVEADPSGPVFCLLLGVSSDYAQPITGQVTSPVIGRTQPEPTLSKRQKMGPAERGEAITGHQLGE